MPQRASALDLLTATHVVAWLRQLSAFRVSTASCVATIPSPLGAAYVGQQRQQPYSRQHSMRSSVWGWLAEPHIAPKARLKWTGWHRDVCRCLMLCKEAFTLRNEAKQELTAGSLRCIKRCLPAMHLAGRISSWFADQAALLYIACQSSQTRLAHSERYHIWSGLCSTSLQSSPCKDIPTVRFSNVSCCP